MNSKESQQINAFVHEVCQHHNAVMAAVFQKAFGCQTLDESIRSESEKRGMARGMIRGRLIGATNYKIRMIRKMLEDDLSPYSIAKWNGTTIEFVEDVQKGLIDVQPLSGTSSTAD